MLFVLTHSIIYLSGSLFTVPARIARRINWGLDEYALVPAHIEVMESGGRTRNSTHHIALRQIYHVFSCHFIFLSTGELFRWVANVKNHAGVEYKKISGL
jgi:hypothetical protein